jgi:pimeloyl-ACP methyl ester carboxylesterase
MINEARRFEHLLGLEQAFTVVYWDQRGCGRSLRRRRDRAGISLEAMAGDAVSLLDLLRHRFGGKTYVAGFSFGGTVGAYAAAQRPDLVATLVTVGMDIDGAAAGTCAYNFAVAAARQRGHRRATRQLQAIGPPPHLTSRQFTTRVRWATNFGGVTTGETYATLARGLLASLARSPDYPAADVIRTVRGISATQATLLPELAALDLARTVPRLDVPVLMVQGRRDQVAPGAAAQRYASTLQAPAKQLVWFDNSAHTPHLEEPGKFRDLLLGIREPTMRQDVTTGAGPPDIRSHERGAPLDALRRRRAHRHPDRPARTQARAPAPARRSERARHLRASRGLRPALPGSGPGRPGRTLARRLAERQALRDRGLPPALAGRRGRGPQGRGGLGWPPWPGQSSWLSMDEDASSQVLVRELKGRYGADYRIVSSSSPEEALAGLKQLQAEGADVPLVLAARLRDSWGALVAPFGGTSARCSTVTSTNAPTRRPGAVCAAFSTGSAPSSAGPAGDCRSRPQPPHRHGRRARILAHARRPSMTARRGDHRGTVAADANELCFTLISPSSPLIMGYGF